MTHSTKGEVVTALDQVYLRSKCNYSIKVSKSVYVRHGAKLTTWEIHLIPVNGYMNNIQLILDAVQKVDLDICVFVTTLEGGCILLY